MKAEKNKKTDFQFIAEQNRWKKILILILILIPVLYSPLIKQEFINYDDDWAVYQNPYITNFSTTQAKELFENFYFGQYSPVAMSVMGVLFKMTDGNPVLLKVGALLLHLLNVVLVFLVLKNLVKSNRIAVLASAVFAFHPVQVEAIAWLSAVFKIGLYSLFTLSGLLCWIKFQKSKNPAFYLLTFLMMLLSCFSKEQAVVFPLYLLLLMYLDNQPVLSKANILKLLPFIALSFIFVLVTYNAVESYNGVEVLKYSLPHRIYLLTYTIVSYFKIFLFPFRLSAFYPHPAANEIFGYFIFPVLMLGILYLLYKAAKNDKLILTGIILFAISVILTFGIQLVSVRETLYADRYLYLGIPGLALALIIAIENVFKKRADIAWGVVILMLFALSVQRIAVFQNSEKLWTDAIAKTYRNALAYNNRGHYYRTKNEISKALNDYNKALEVNPKYYLTLNNRGKIYFDQGKYDLAIKDFNSCLEISPEFVSALSNRGAYYGMKNEYEKALADLNKALEIDPNSTDALSNRGLLYLMMKEYQKSIEDNQKYLEIKPGDPDIINSIALGYLNLKEYEKALAASNECISLDPTKGAFFMNRSSIYDAAGDKTRALNDAMMAKKLGFRVDDSYINSLRI